MNKNWLTTAKELLEKSLAPIPVERNELDWKVALSDNEIKIHHHLSAFANSGGGFLVFGVNNTGTVIGVTKKDAEEILKKVGNIARDGLEPSLTIDHEIADYQGAHVLFIRVVESFEKPVHIRGKSIEESYIRSSGQTRKMDKGEIKQTIIDSTDNSFEDGIALSNISTDEVLNYLDFQKYFELLKNNIPTSSEGIISQFINEKFIITNEADDTVHITNLGAILFAKNITEFPTLERKAMRLIIYDGNNRAITKKEIVNQKGYAIAFVSMIEYIENILPENEVIEKALRKKTKMYPIIAIRELVANALIHQNFYMKGTGPTIEIFDDRIEITNPGNPIIQPVRFIDYPPQSRNERLAHTLRRLNICEERGSGIDKVILSVELYQLPAPEFIATDDNLRVILYSYKEFSKMDKNAKIRAAYQHCVIKYVSNTKMTNSSLRDRFNISEKNYPMASRIIADTVKAGLIKSGDLQSTSRKHAYYVPFWA